MRIRISSGTHAHFQHWVLGPFLIPDMRVLLLVLRLVAQGVKRIVGPRDFIFCGWLHGDFA